MSLQVFLQAQLIGTAEFLSVKSPVYGKGAKDLQGRFTWLNLLCEVLPRALLAELGLSRMLLGSSSAEQFLLVLAEEDVARANEFLAKAAYDLAKLSGGTLRLVWASTEDLGAWPVARKRLEDALSAFISTPLAGADPQDLFTAAAVPVEEENNGVSTYFSGFAEGFTTATRVAFLRENPALFTWGEGDYSWPLVEQSSQGEDAILFPRRLALDDDG